MAENENTIFDGDFRNWADIVVKVWKQKLIQLKVGAYRTKRQVTHESLYNSLINEVYAQSGGDSRRIDFFFKEYGVYVDNGVGRETSGGNSGDVKTKRKRKQWYSKSLYFEVYKLQEHLSKTMGKAAAETIMLSMPEIIRAATSDLKYSRYKNK